MFDNRQIWVMDWAALRFTGTDFRKVREAQEWHLERDVLGARHKFELPAS